MSAFTPSSNQNPCPVCDRTKDGDCRILDSGLVFCHTIRNGVAPGKQHPDRPYVYCGHSDEAQGFGKWKPEHLCIDLPAKAPRKYGIRYFDYFFWDGTPCPVQRYRKDVEGQPKEVKWCEGGLKGRPQLDVAPYLWEKIGDAKQIFVVRGELKAELLAGKGFKAISLLNQKDELLTAKLQAMRVNEVEIVLVPDCDTADLNKWFSYLSNEVPGVKQLLAPGFPWDKPPADGGLGIEDWIYKKSPSNDEILAAISDIKKGEKDSDIDDEDPAVAIERLVNELLDLRLTTADTWAKEMATISSITRTYGVQRQDVERRILEALANRWNLSITQSHSGRRTNRNSIATQETDEQQMLIHGFLPWKRDALIFGPGGAGKTTAAVALAWSVISGTPFLDHQIEGDITGKVLWIGSDGGDGAYDMWRNTAQDLGFANDPRWVDGCIFWGSEPTNDVGSWSCTPAGLQEIKTELEAGGYALVVIDSWKAVLELAGIDFGIGPVGTVVRFLQALIGQYCSALYLHHPAGNSKGKGIAGTGGNQNINQIPYAVHQLSPEPISEGQSPCVRWDVHKLRGYQSRNFLYRLTDVGLQVTQGDVITNCADAILITIADLEALGTATSSHRIKSMLSTIKEGTVSNNLTRLRQNGFLKKSGSAWHLTQRGKLAHNRLFNLNQGGGVGVGSVYRDKRKKAL